MVKAIVFDMNGVFVEAPEKSVLERIRSLKGTGKWIALSNYYLNIWEFERGFLAPFEFWKKVFVSLTEQEFHGLVEGAYSEQFQRNEDLYSLAQQLSAGYDLYCLSNSNFLQGKEYRRQKLYAPFKRLFLSHETHEIKPFPMAFEHFLKETGLKARDCVFVDDWTVNVLASAALGFRGVVFHDAGDLKEKLAKLGVL